MHFTAPRPKMWTDSTASTARAGRRALALERCEVGPIATGAPPGGHSPYSGSAGCAVRLGRGDQAWAGFVAPTQWGSM